MLLLTLLVATFLPLCFALEGETQTFLSPTDNLGSLQEATYIATGLPAILELAVYLDLHPEAHITRLLLADATVRDLDSNFGVITCGATAYSQQSTRCLGAPAWDGTTPLSDEQEDFIADLEYNNAKADRHRRRAIRDIAAPLARILERTAPSLESFSYLMYRSAGDGEDDRRLSVLDNDFPSLRFFTFRNGGWKDDTFSILQFAPHAPILSHLHVVAEPIQSLAALQQAFPHLTHLRITGFNFLFQLPQELQPDPANFYSMMPDSPLSVGMAFLVPKNAWLTLCIFYQQHPGQYHCDHPARIR
jgi:hypothetical protein